MSGHLNHILQHLEAPQDGRMADGVKCGGQFLLSHNSHITLVHRKPNVRKDLKNSRFELDPTSGQEAARLLSGSRRTDTRRAA